jgi:hypothetical protein
MKTADALQSLANQIAHSAVQWDGIEGNQLIAFAFRDLAACVQRTVNEVRMEEEKSPTPPKGEAK